MKLIDKVLSALGLMKKTKHDEVVESHKKFTRLLAQAAKDAGINVLLDDQCLRYVEIDSDVFVLGSSNIITDCLISGGSIRLGPSANNNYLANIGSH